MDDRECFVRLAIRLEQDLTEGSASRALFEFHRTVIQSLFSNEPDLPLHQDSVAGFLYGFRAAGSYLLPAGSLEQEAMVPVLGGLLLVGRYLPLGPAWTRAGRVFLARIAAALDCWDGDAVVAVPIVRGEFAAAGDVPMTTASLGGCCLGALYGARDLEEAGGDPQ